MTAKDQSAFTIVEVLVAAVVISFSVIGTMALVRKAQEMTSLDRHRRAARLVIDKHLEQTKYLQMGYPDLDSGTVTRAVTIDSLSTGKLTGTMTDSISGRLTKAGVNATGAPYKKVVLTVNWREWGSNVNSSVRVEKWVSP